MQQKMQKNAKQNAKSAKTTRGFFLISRISGRDFRWHLSLHFGINCIFLFFFCHFLGMSSTMNSTVLSAFFESRIWNAKWKSYPNSWAQNQEFGMQDGTHTQTHGGMQKQIPCHNPVCGSESHIILYTIDGTIPLTLLLQSKVSISH